jgi:competence protein ComEA
VRDAIEAAGGLERDAAPGELNLAQVLADGQQIVIGTRQKPSGEVRESSGPGTTDESGSPSTDSGAGNRADVDLNRASQSQLEELPGVGPVTAAKIVAWREEHTRFSKVEELQEIDGIGPKTYAEIAPHVRV